MLNINSGIISVLAEASQGAYLPSLIDLQDYIAEERIDDPDTGFSLTIYKSVSNEEYIFAFRGTDLSAQDFYTDLNAGMKQWTIENSDKVKLKLLQYIEGKPESVVHFTGHSLGGALAQFAAYEYASTIADSNTPGQLAEEFYLVTFNALGGELALSDSLLYSGSYDQLLVETISAAHFKIKGDVVSRLGDDHVGGELLVIDKPVESNFAAHAIGNFTGSDGGPGVTTEEYETAVIEQSYLNITQLLSVSGIVASLGDDGEFTSAEALLRTVSAFSFGLANADSEDLSALVVAFFGDPSTIGQSQYDTWIFLGEQAIDALQATRQLTIGGNLVGAYALTFATVMQKAAQFWEQYPNIADVFGGSIDLYMDNYANPATALVRAALDYSLETEISAAEYPEAIDFVAKSIEWMELYFSPQALNKLYIQGYAGDDVLSGNDLYWPGKDPDDYILGHAGDDVLEGGEGTDYLIGGTGADQYIWNTGDGDDVIGDFDDAGDRIIVNGIDLATLQFDRTSADSPFYVASSNPDITLHYDGDFLTVNIGSGPDTGSITLTQYSPATGADYGIVLNEAVVTEPVTDVVVTELGGDEGQVQAFAYWREQQQQNGLNWADIALRFTAADVTNYAGGTAFGQIGGAFEGGPQSDHLTGDGSSNALHGLAGNDQIDGGAGDDYLEGWAGSDTLSGGDGNDLLFGGVRFDLAGYFGSQTAQDQFYLSQLVDAPEDINILDGGAGGDYVSGGMYTDYLEGGAGIDYLLGGSGQDYISGGSDGDVIYGDSVLGERFEEPSPGAELLLHLEIGFADGTDGVGQYDDIVHAGTGNDIVWGELGNDELHGDAGDDNLIGDRYNDPTYFANELAPSGSTSPDLNTVLHGDDRLYGGAGSDLLVGLGGNDYLAGGKDSDSLVGGAGDDTYYFETGDGLDYVEDSQGMHTLLFSGMALNDLQVIFQGDQVRVGTGYGAEGFYFSKDEWGKVAIALNTPDALVERSRLDTLYFDTAGNLLLTVNGSDALTESGRDQLFTVETNDPDKPRIVVASGADKVEIEALAEGGASMRVYAGGIAKLIVDLSAQTIATGFDFLQLLDGPTMSLIGFTGDVSGSGGNDRIIGSGGSDTLRGAGGSDLIEGRGGDDILDGGSGDDVLRGESGNDSLLGGSGSDYLDGGAGNDDLDGGGGGTDTFYFEEGDGQDRFTGTDIDYLVFGAGVNPDSVVLNYTGTADSTFRMEYGAGNTVTSNGTTSSYWLRGINVNGVTIPLVQRSDLTDGTFHDTRWNDIYETGDGNDTIFISGWGDDAFRFETGDGQDTVMVDNGYYPQTLGEIRLGTDVDLTALSFGFANGSATISYGAGDQVTLVPDTVYTFRDNTFTRFTLVSEADPGWIPEIRAESYVGNLYGSHGDDRIVGSAHIETIIPGYGNDIIEAGDGFDRIVLNDVYISGGVGIGQKRIWGGAGNDVLETPLHQGMTFHYELGDGHDTIHYDWSFSLRHPYRFGPDVEQNVVVFQAGGSDTLEFGAGISLGDLGFTRLGDDLSIALANGSGGITVSDYFHAYQPDIAPWSGNVAHLFSEDYQMVPDSLLHPALLAAMPENPISQLRFADGAVYDMGTVLGSFLEISDATILGTEGDDYLSGTEADDVIHALGGNDTIEEFVGVNRILAGPGNDQIIVAGENTIDPGPGDDWVNMAAGSHVLTFGPNSGNDFVILNVDSTTAAIAMDEGLTTADIDVSLVEADWGQVPIITLKASGAAITLNSLRYIAALDQWETVPDSDAAALHFSDGTVITGSELYTMAGINEGESFIGSDEDDVMVGTDGDDTFIGGRGNDLMDGAGGDDIFLVEGRRQGKDHILGGAGFDTILGGEGNDRISLIQLTESDGVELVDGRAGVNTIAGSGSANVLDFSAVELINISMIEGRGGRDTITGSAGDDVIRGGRGRDTLSGGAGDDTYVFAAGDGRDVINNADADPESFDVLDLEELEFDQVWLSKKNQHLAINFEGSTHRVLIKGWYNNKDDQLDAIHAGGRILMRDQVDQLVNAMATFDVPDGVGEIISDQARTELEPVLTSVWQMAS